MLVFGKVVVSIELLLTLKPSSARFFYGIIKK